MLDVSGKIILNINKALKEGKNTFKLDLESLKERIYFIQVNFIDNSVKTIKVVKQ